ncbi:MAG: protein kinase [Cyanobacteria bacterium SZAS LIN-3]|nr:protein kinase [Cyanobacteria bacterium SZAS LIN-3]
MTQEKPDNPDVTVKVSAPSDDDNDKTQPSIVTFQSEASPAETNMPKKLRKLRKTHEGITFARSDGKKDSASEINLVEGAIIGGIYRINKRIGQGGMGEVYLAEHVTLAKKCALKVIPPEQVTDVGWLRFQTEAKAVARLDHINLVKVSDLGIHEGCLPFYAMEYVEGETLADILLRQKKLPLKATLDIFMQLCDGLDYAHRNSIVHRDLKPANIMLSQAPGGKYNVKVLDFGLAKLVQQDKNKQSLTAVGEIFGSPFYMSPEQCGGEKIDNRSDIYSLGCTMFECLTGRPPFTGRLAAAIVYSHQEAEAPSLESVTGPKQFPEALEVVMAKLLRKNPFERYQTMAELRSDLERVSRGENVQPVYMPRTKDVAAELSSSRGMKAVRLRSEGNEDIAEEEADSNDDEDEEDYVKTHKPRALVWALVGVLLAGLVGAYWYYSNHKATLAKVTPVLASEPADMKTMNKDGNDVFGAMNDTKVFATIDDDRTTAPPSAKDTEPYSSIVEQNGMRFRRFRFPMDVSIGQIRSVANLLPVQARGQIEFHENDPVYFIPDSMLAKYPSYLSRFKAGDLYSLAISGFDNSDALLKAAAVVPGVQRLSVSRCQTMTSEALRGIEGYKSIVDFDCAFNKIDVSPIANVSRLRELKILNLSGEKNVTPVIKKLAQSPNLMELQMDSCELDEESIRILSQIPNLVKLSLDNVSLANQDLATLSKAPNLTLLSIIKVPVDAETIKIIKSFKKLQAIQLVSEPNKSAVPTPQLLEYRRQLPNLTVN